MPTTVTTFTLTRETIRELQDVINHEMYWRRIPQSDRDDVSQFVLERLITILATNYDKAKATSELGYAVRVCKSLVRVAAKAGVTHAQRFSNPLGDFDRPSNDPSVADLAVNRTEMARQFSTTPVSASTRALLAEGVGGALLDRRARHRGRQEASDLVDALIA